LVVANLFKISDMICVCVDGFNCMQIGQSSESDRERDPVTSSLFQTTRSLHTWKSG
jgi:hypothetical protein